MGRLSPSVRPMVVCGFLLLALWLPGHAERSPLGVLARADDAYRHGRWGEAADLYRRAHREQSAPERDDEILFRIGHCSEKAIPEFVALVDPNRFNPAHWDDTERLRPFLDWLRAERGYYLQGSEGDSVWRYDGVAYRELLKSHPNSAYAGHARLQLVRIDALMRHDPAIFLLRNSEALTAARDIVAAYENILSRYPENGLRGDCKELISGWREYLKGGAAPRDWLWIRD